MKGYLLAAVGVIFLTVIVSFIVPEGKLKKTVNFILRLVCICVLIQPVTSIFKFTPQTETNLYDYDYICEVYSQNQSKLVTDKVAEDLGIENCVCTVEIVYDGTQIKENGIKVVGNFVDDESIKIITEYLESLGYINITVNEKDANLLKGK